jgi:hypothetical protein
LVANIPVLLFCIAFGLSMDYEVFLVARIREFWLASGKTRADNDESVARGIAHTGRIITAAALIMSISFAALIAAQVTVMRMFGLGLTLPSSSTRPWCGWCSYPPSCTLWANGIGGRPGGWSRCTDVWDSDGDPRDRTGRGPGPVSSK